MAECSSVPGQDPQSVQKLTGVRDLGDLVASEAVPPLVGPLVDKINDVEGVDKVDERVANIAVVGEVNSQVHEIVFAPARLVNDALEHLLVHLVGDIA